MKSLRRKSPKPEEGVVVCRREDLTKIGIIVECVPAQELPIRVCWQYGDPSGEWYDPGRLWDYESVVSFNLSQFICRRNA